MKLLDNPMTCDEVRSTLDTIQGNIARICVSDDATEIVRSLGFATSKLSMIAYSRVMKLNEKEIQ